MTSDGMNAEFSISITKKAGDPQMDFRVEGASECAFNALIAVLVDLTLHAATDTDAMKGAVVKAYREAVDQRKEAGEKP